MDRTCDTNVVQSLYILLHRPDKIRDLESANSTMNMMELYETSKKIRRGQKKFLYVTPMVMEEVEECEKKLPGIVQFTKDNFLMKVTTSKRMIDAIIELEDMYLTPDIPLGDSTRALQSAIQIEYKEGLPSRADAHIVAENNTLLGNPIYTLNEKHLICMKSSSKPNSPLRSTAILKKNEDMLHSGYPLPKIAKRHLKKPTSTTFKVKNINKDKDALISAMIKEL